MIRDGAGVGRRIDPPEGNDTVDAQTGQVVGIVRIPDNLSAHTVECLLNGIARRARIEEISHGQAEATAKGVLNGHHF